MYKCIVLDINSYILYMYDCRCCILSNNRHARTFSTCTLWTCRCASLSCVCEEQYIPWEQVPRRILMQNNTRDLCVSFASYRTLQSPAGFFITLTVPVVDRDKPNDNWNKWLNVTHCVTAPLFFALVTKCKGMAQCIALQHLALKGLIILL